jgi:hypothetical protein
VLLGLIDPGTQRRAGRFATLVVMAMGTLWLAERVLQAG